MVYDRPFCKILTFLLLTQLFVICVKCLYCQGLKSLPRATCVGCRREPRWWAGEEMDKFYRANRLPVDLSAHMEERSGRSISTTPTLYQGFLWLLTCFSHNIPHSDIPSTQHGFVWHLFQVGGHCRSMPVLLPMPHGWRSN